MKALLKNNLLTSALLTLCGCETYKTALVNKEGAITHCDQSGWRLVGGAIAGSQHSDCIKNAHEAGYSEVSETH